MPKRWPKPVKDRVIELRSQGVMPTEIVKRLNEDTAGLGYPADIKRRTVVEYIAKHQAKHGPFPPPSREVVDTESIQKAKAALFARVCQEVVAKERRAKGKLREHELRECRAAYDCLDRMEAIEYRAEKRRRQPSEAERAGAQGKRGAKPETTVERLARQERERAASGPSTPDPTSTEPIKDKGDGMEQGAPGPTQNRTKAGSGSRSGGPSSPEPPIVPFQPALAQSDQAASPDA